MIQSASSLSAKMNPKIDICILSLLFTALACWSYAYRVAGPIGWVAVLGLPPLATIVYAHLHRHYHAFSKNQVLYHAIGILYSSLMGLSWVLYRSHHANHHRFGNAEGDWSKTTNAQGEPIIGWKYLAREALRPFIFHLCPFLSILGMKSKRNGLALVDESSRVICRGAFYLALGMPGLIALLVWQLIFLVTLMYLNYLQHFEIPVGHGAVWPNRLFNKLTVNLGYHDQHHALPSYADTQLPRIPARLSERTIIGLFNPRIFLLFLFKPSTLKRELAAP